MKILHVIASLAARHGGPQAALPHMCGALASRGHHVEIFTTNDGWSPGKADVPLGAPVSMNGFSVTYFPVQRPRWYLTSLPLARAIRDRVREFDAVHIHGLYRFHTLAAAFFCRRFGVPYIVRPHGTLNPYHRGVRRWRKAFFDAAVGWRNMNRASAIHYVAESEKKYAEQAGVRARGFVVPLGANVSAPIPSNEEVRWTEFEGRALVTFLGRLTEKKGLDVLCDAFVLVAKQHERAHLAIAGPDDEGIGSMLRGQAEMLPLRDRVTFLGLVTGSRKSALLMQSSVFVLPSLDEAFPNAVVEAMAAGVPVVITNNVGIEKDVARAEAGLVVERSPGAVAEAVLSLLADPARARTLGENGKHLAREYSWERAAERLEGMYAAVI